MTPSPFFSCDTICSQLAAPSPQIEPCHSTAAVWCKQSNQGGQGRSVLRRQKDVATKWHARHAGPWPTRIPRLQAERCEQICEAWLPHPPQPLHHHHLRASGGAGRGKMLPWPRAHMIFRSLAVLAFLTPLTHLPPAARADEHGAAGGAAAARQRGQAD